MKVWSLAPTKPPFSREVTGPYNYIFSDNLPEPVTDMIGQINSGNPGIAPAFGQIMYATTVAGLAATFSNDLWGWSKDVQFYIRATTLRLTEGGGAVITSRANIGQVIHDFTQWFNGRMEYYRSIGQFPLNRARRNPLLRPRSTVGCRGRLGRRPHHLGHAPSPRPSGMGHRHLAQRPRRPRNPRHVRVLPRNGTVDA